MDLTGQRYGKLTVIKKTEERYHGHVLYECKCDCGVIKKLPANALRSGRTKSCGCGMREANDKKLIDLTGKRFGSLTVLGLAEDYISPSGMKMKRWRCRCDCGKHVEAIGGALKRGGIKSCGCQKNKFDNLTGKRFGRLTAIELDTEKTDKDTYWICKCDCGNEKSIAAQSLKHGYTKSCGCIEDENYVFETKLNRIENDTPQRNNKTGCAGVTFIEKLNKYQARIGFQGERYYLGVYQKKEDAITARKCAEKELWGNFLEWYAENYPDMWTKRKKKSLPNKQQANS